MKSEFRDNLKITDLVGLSKKDVKNCYAFFVEFGSRFTRVWQHFDYVGFSDGHITILYDCINKRFRESDSIQLFTFHVIKRKLI